MKEKKKDLQTHCEKKEEKQRQERDRERQRERQREKQHFFGFSPNGVKFITNIMINREIGTSFHINRLLLP